MILSRTTKTISLATLALVPLLIAGCAPQELETPPVSVETKQGTVVCQLYTHELVYWDRAVHVPSGMDPDHADGICRAKGQEIAREIRAAKL